MIIFSLLYRSKGSQIINGDEEEEEDDYYFDAKQGFNLDHRQDQSYVPVNVPKGGRLVFTRISAVGTARDRDEKAFSVYYLDVHCNIASPSSWYTYRRYSQFRRLSDVLRSDGYYVPVLPPKRLLGTFSLEFVKQRKIELEVWLQALSEQHLTHTGAKDPQNNEFYRRFLTEGANLPPDRVVS